MTTDEAARLHLYEQARRAFDESAADTLMNTLPRDPDRFATKDDLDGLGSQLGREIALVRTELRSEVASLRTDLRTEIALVRGEIPVLGNELRAEMVTRNSELLRTLFLGMVASNATLVGLVFAAVRLG